MTDDLYRQQILDHWRSPRNFGVLDHATHTAARNNPLCGDEISVMLAVADGHIADIRFTGRGCAISIAAMSMLSETLSGAAVDDVKKMSAATVIALLGATPSPSRMKCALLGLETVDHALFGHS